MSMIILLGPPGSGKGTQTAKLAKTLSLAVIGTGDLLRSEVKADTPLGQQAAAYMREGRLVPDAVMIQMVCERLKQNDCQDGVIFDGFPRTEKQAIALEDAGVHVSCVCALMVPDQAIIERMQGRRYHPASGRTYHVDYHPPQEEGLDDETGEPLVIREDDQPKTVKARLDVYHQNTKPLLAHYQNESPDIFHVIDGVGSIEDITKALLEAIG